jgi:hypothetical protein
VVTVVLKRSHKVIIALGIGISGSLVALATGIALSTMFGARSYELPQSERRAWMSRIEARTARQDAQRKFIRLPETFAVPSGLEGLRSEATTPGDGRGLLSPSSAQEAALFLSDPAYLYWTLSGHPIASQRDERQSVLVADLVHDVALAVLRETRDSPHSRLAVTVAAQTTALDRIFTACVAPDRDHAILALGKDLRGDGGDQASRIGRWIGHETASYFLTEEPCSEAS